MRIFYFSGYFSALKDSIYSHKDMALFRIFQCPEGFDRDSAFSRIFKCLTGLKIFT